MRSSTSVVGIFVKVLVVVFVVEALVMFALPAILPLTISEKISAFVDASLLTMTAAPLLWWVIIKPILREQSDRKEAERVLLQSQAKLQVAAEIQKQLLPESAPQLPGVDISARLKPAEATSGDFYDFPALPDGSYGIVIADVSGHGIDSALLATAASAYLRALTRTSMDVGKLVTLLNDFLVEQPEEQRFLTLFFARIDPKTLSLSYAAAGHRAYHVLGPDKVHKLDATSFPLGLMPGMSVTSSGPIQLRPGQTLLFVTDGIEESSNPDGELFGSARMLELVQSHPELTSQELLDLLYREAEDFSRGTPQRDDMTGIILKVL